MMKTATKAAEPQLALEGEVQSPAKTKKPAKKTTHLAVAASNPRRQVKSASDKVRAESRSIIEISKECAMNPLVDAGKMREVIAMALAEQNRIDDRIFQLAKMEVQNAIPPIKRDSYNEHTKSKWAKLENISAVADPIIRRNGFSLSYGSADCPLKDHYRITCDVTHTPTGYTKHYWIDVGMDSVGAKGGGTKSLAQGSGSSVTYARRFLKVMIFDINIVGEDFDGSRFTVQPKQDPAQNNHEVEQQDDGEPKITAKQVLDLRDAIEDCGVGMPRFLTTYQIDKIESLPARRYAEAAQACADFKNRMKK